ncbi:hypothetical protein ACFLVF_01050 [Chloroflexota bacterium]
MGDIKNAWEIAEEKIARIGKATEDERLAWEYVPEGEKLGGKYLKDDINLAAELERYETVAKKYVVSGASDILLRSIDLPKNEAAKKLGKRAMDGLKAIKSDKVGVENTYSKMRRIFNHYEQEGQQQRQQAYQTLKTEFEAKVQQAIAQQMGTAASYKVDVEQQPQFHEEWRRLQLQLDAQYIKLLDEYKQELRLIQ